MEELSKLCVFDEIIETSGRVEGEEAEYGGTCGEGRVGEEGEGESRVSGAGGGR